MRARRRLIGSAVLVIGAVVAVPMVLESTPRPSSPVTAGHPGSASGDVTVGAIPAPEGAGVGRGAVVARVDDAAAPSAVALPKPASAAAPAPAFKAPQVAAGLATPKNGLVDAYPAAASEAELARRQAEARQAAEKKDAERRLAEKRAAEKHAAEKRAAEQRAAEQRLADKKLAEKKLAEKKLAEKKLAEKRAAEQLTAEKKSDDRKATEKKAMAERKADKERADKEKSAKKAEAQRFVIQVGAYSESSAAHEVRRRIDKLGLHSVEQEVQTASGKRIRVRLGPYASRDEAERAAAKLRSGGLNAAILGL